jgi:hypothetical protein
MIFQLIIVSVFSRLGINILPYHPGEYRPLALATPSGTAWIISIIYGKANAETLREKADGPDTNIHRQGSATIGLKSTHAVELTVAFKFHSH